MQQAAFSRHQATSNKQQRFLVRDFEEMVHRATVEIVEIGDDVQTLPA
jgi:hypothetical protein